MNKQRRQELKLTPEIKSNHLQIMHNTYQMAFRSNFINWNFQDAFNLIKKKRQ